MLLRGRFVVSFDWFRWSVEDPRRRIRIRFASLSLCQSQRRCISPVFAMHCHSPISFYICHRYCLLILFSSFTGASVGPHQSRPLDESIYPPAMDNDLTRTFSHSL